MEGAATQTTIVLFSFRRTTGIMIHDLGLDGEAALRLGFPDFEATHAQQVTSGAATKLKSRPGCN